VYTRGDRRGDCRGDDCRDDRSDSRGDDRPDSRGDDRPVYTLYKLPEEHSQNICFSHATVQGQVSLLIFLEGPELSDDFDTFDHTIL